MRLRRSHSFLFVLTVLLLSCQGEGENELETPPITPQADTLTTDSVAVEEEIVEEYIIDSLEQSIIDAGLLNIQDSIPDILVELKYSTTDNFMEEDVYGHMERAYLQPEVVMSLKKSQEKLKEIDSSLTLLVYDAVRPRRVQQIMWDVLDMPIWEKTKFVSNPANGSIHNYGCAVDLTIAHEDGTALDMGAGYDDPAKIAYPRHEQAYLDSGMLNLQQIENRELLRDVMKAGGFWGIQTEWWHFNRYSRDRAKEMFEILE
ncbi:MAG: M15 family metallopeptidase [Flavobacteriales bacterium]|nr:M15 family metallopeptidase [Flavobacteriales bacterium]